MGRELLLPAPRAAQGEVGLPVGLAQHLQVASRCVLFGCALSIVARGEQDFHPRDVFASAGSKLIAGDAAGHDDIAEDEIDPCAGFDKGEGGGSSVRFDDAIAEAS